MAVDENFIWFIIPAIVAVLTALVALPSKRRIEMDPSTSFQRGRRALVNIVAIFVVAMGAIVSLVGGTLNFEPLVGSVNMVHVAGISLVAMGVVLMVASIKTRRIVRAASKGTHEVALEVGSATTGALPQPTGAARPYSPPRPFPSESPPYGDDGYRGPQGRPPSANRPPEDRPQRRYPPPREGYPPERPLPPRRRPPTG